MQKIPITVARAVPEAPSPQMMLTIPLARVIQAMAFTKLGFCCMSFLLIYIKSRGDPSAPFNLCAHPGRLPLRYWFISLLYTPHQERSCKSIRGSGRFNILEIQLQRFATVVFVQFKLIEDIHAWGQRSMHATHTKANTIEEASALIVQSHFQMPALRTNRAKRFHFDIARDKDRTGISVSGRFQIFEMVQ